MLMEFPLFECRIFLLIDSSFQLDFHGLLINFSFTLLTWKKNIIRNKNKTSGKNDERSEWNHEIRIKLASFNCNKLLNRSWMEGREVFFNYNEIKNWESRKEPFFLFENSSSKELENFHKISQKFFFTNAHEIHCLSVLPRCWKIWD